jgi:hypothetical protein
VALGLALRGAPTQTPAKGDECTWREHLATARMVELLARLGSYPLLFGAESAGVGRLLDRFCPPTASALHGLRGQGWPSPVEHLVVAPRGAVVVVACLSEGPPRGPAVREALSGRRKLQAWLGRTPWSATPVLAAVCVLPLWAAQSPGAVAAGEGLSARVVGDVWVGHAGRLPAWLGSGGSLGPAERQDLRRFLLEHLVLGAEGLPPARGRGSPLRG